METRAPFMTRNANNRPSVGCFDVYDTKKNQIVNILRLETCFLFTEQSILLLQDKVNCVVGKSYIYAIFWSILDMLFKFNYVKIGNSPIFI